MRRFPSPAGRLDVPRYEVNKDQVQRSGWATPPPHTTADHRLGGVDGYYAPCRYPAVITSATSRPCRAHLDPVDSPCNSGWFLSTLGAAALTFLEQQPEVDAQRLGAYGHSMGGKLTVMLAGADDRLKAAAPSCGGVTDRNPRRTHPLNHDSVSLERIDCPIFFLSPANDYHGRIDDLQTALEEINSEHWRETCAPHHDHQDTKDYEVATHLWFDQVLRDRFETPQTPRTELNLSGTHGFPELTVVPDASREILGVDVFVSRDAAKQPSDRFWHYAPATQQGDRWVAPLELYGLDQPLWVYANVRYSLDQTITGAGYYYGIYSTKSFVLSSRMTMVSPEDLQQAGVQSVLQPDGVIEDFAAEWQKEWFLYGNEPAIGGSPRGNWGTSCMPLPPTRNWRSPSGPSRTIPCC